MPLTVRWKQDPKTRQQIPHVTDTGSFDRSCKEVREVFQHVLSTGTNFPTKMKRGAVTFWRTEAKQMNKTEFALNSAFGLSIALAVGATITPVGWAFLATAGLTAIAGFTAGKVQGSINYRYGRKNVLSKTDNAKIPAGFISNPEKYELRGNYFSVLQLGNWEVAKPMLKALWKHLDDTDYFKGHFLGGDRVKADKNIEEIVALFEAGEFKSKKRLDERAATSRNMYRSNKKFDWAHKMKKFSYYAAWLHEFNRSWIDVINKLYGQYDELSEKLIDSAHYQFHLAGNHQNCSNCACSAELDELSRISPPGSHITLSRRMQQDLGLNSTGVGPRQVNEPEQVELNRPFQTQVMGHHSQSVGHQSTGQRVGQSGVVGAQTGVAFVDTWSAADACAETQAGNMITASLGSFASTGMGTVVAGAAGGVAGAGIGKLFGLIGRYYTIKIPAKGQMGKVFETWLSGEVFDPGELMRQGCFSADYLEYVISKLAHYHTKYDGIVKDYITDMEKLRHAEDGRFPFHSCDHARALMSKHAALFLQLAKFHMYVEYLNLFSHAIQGISESLVFDVEKKLKNPRFRPEVRTWLSSLSGIDKWIRYYNSI